MRCFFILVCCAICLFLVVGLGFAQNNSSQKERVLSAREEAIHAESARKHCEKLGFPASVADNRCFTIYPNALMTFGKGFSDGLAKVTVDGKAGFIDTNGKLVIAANLADAGHFHEGLAPFEDREGKWGFIDKQGKVVITPRYDWALCFFEGLAGVQLGSKWGFVDRKGELVIDATFDSVSSFSEGLAAVTWSQADNQRNELTGFIDSTGEIVISGSFGSVSRGFDGGIALVNRNVDCPFGSCSETFAINKSGVRLWTLQSWYISRFTDDVIVVAAGKDADGHDLYSALGRDGKPLFMKNFSRLGEFANGLAPARKTWSGKHGFVDKGGEFVIEDQFQWAHPFSEGLAAVEIGSKYGFIDSKGRIVIDPQFAFADRFQQGFALVAPTGVGKEKTGYINKSGKLIWKPTK